MNEHAYYLFHNNHLIAIFKFYNFETTMVNSMIVS